MSDPDAIREEARTAISRILMLVVLVLGLVIVAVLGLSLFNTTQRNDQFRQHRIRSEEHAACTDAKIDELRTDIYNLLTQKVAPGDFPSMSRITCPPADFAVPSVDRLLHLTTTTTR